MASNTVFVLIFGNYENTLKCSQVKCYLDELHIICDVDGFKWPKVHL